MKLILKILAIGLLAIGFSGNAAVYADTRNHVNFTFPNGDLFLVSVGTANSSAFVNWYSVPDGCADSVSRGELFGIVTGDGAEYDGTTTQSFYDPLTSKNESGTVSCMYNNTSDQTSGDLHYDGISEFYVDAGFEGGSKHVAAAFSNYMGVGTDSSSHVVHANKSAFEEAEGSQKVVNGFPTTLQLFFAVDLVFDDLETDPTTTYTCQNVVFALQQVESDATAAATGSWAAKAVTQGDGLIGATEGCIVSVVESAGLGCVWLAVVLVKDLITDLIAALFSADDYTLWVGQSYNDGNPNGSVTLPPGVAGQVNNGGMVPVNTGNPSGQYQVGIVCEDSNGDQKNLFFTQVTGDDETFSVVQAVQQN
jgi:hypothetical protein